MIKKFTNTDYNIENLDEATLRFAIEKAWAFRFMCKNTKAGRIEAQAYERVENVLKHFLKETTQ